MTRGKVVTASNDSLSIETHQLPTIAGAGAGVEDYHLRVFRDEAGRDHLRCNDDSAAAFGGGVDPARGGEMESRRADLVLACGERPAVALLDRAQRPAIAERAGHTQAAR